jgi:hypothetical protein
MLLRLMLIGLPAKDKLAILIKSQCPTFEKEVYVQRETLRRIVKV